MFETTMFAFALIASLALSGANAVITINSNGTMTANGLTLFGISRSARSASYFLISDDLLDWNTALKVCQAQGTRLVSIENANKDADLIGFLAGRGVTAAWTAGNDLIANGQYNWFTTKVPFGSYTNWRGGVATNLGDCQCVAINARKQSGCVNCAGEYKWDEDNCTIRKRFVCELVL